jgi:hypothetical protein
MTSSSSQLYCIMVHICQTILSLLSTLLSDDSLPSDQSVVLASFLLSLFIHSCSCLPQFNRKTHNLQILLRFYVLFSVFVLFSFFFFFCFSCSFAIIFFRCKSALSVASIFIETLLPAYFFCIFLPSSLLKDANLSINRPFFFPKKHVHVHTRAKTTSTYT